MRARAIVGAALLAAASVVGVVGFVGVAGATPAEEAPAGAEAEPEEPSHAAEECLHILEEGGEPDDCQESPSPILPATNELIWGVLSFAVLMVLLSKLALPGVQKAMKARTERIQADLDDAEKVKAEASTILEDYQRQLADAKNESSRIIEEARQTAEQLRRDLMGRAETEVAELRQRTRDDIAAAQERATADLQARVGELAIELAEKVVGANLDRETNMALIERYIAEVESQRA